MYKNLSPAALGVSGFQSELIELALSHGFKGLEIDVTEFLKRCAKQGPGHAQRLLNSADLQLGGLRLPVRLSADESTFAESLASLEQGAEHLKSAGCDHLLTIVEPGSESLPYHENFELHRQRLVKLADVLDPAGIRVGVGFSGAASAREDANLEFIHDLSGLMALVDAAAATTGILLDVWEVTVAGGSVEDAKQVAAKRLVAVNLADGPADKSVEQWQQVDRLLPEAGGPIDHASLLTWLAEIQFEGPVTPMPDASHFSGGTREATIKQTADQFDEIWTAAGLSPGGKLTTPADQTA